MLSLPGGERHVINPYSHDSTAVPSIFCTTQQRPCPQQFEHVALVIRLRYIPPRPYVQTGKDNRFSLVRHVACDCLALRRRPLSWSLGLVTDLQK